MTECPHCNSPLTGLGTFCWECERYADPDTFETTEASQKLSEAEIQQGIKSYLDLLDDVNYIDTSQDQHAQITRGLSDLIVFGNGLIVFAEIKTEDGKQSEYQERFQSWCERAGVDYEIWRSVEDAKNYIE